MFVKTTKTPSSQQKNGQNAALCLIDKVLSSKSTKKPASAGFRKNKSLKVFKAGFIEL